MSEKIKKDIELYVTIRKTITIEADAEIVTEREWTPEGTETHIYYDINEETMREEIYAELKRLYGDSLEDWEER